MDSEARKKFAAMALVLLVFAGTAVEVIRRQGSLPGQRGTVEIINPSPQPAAGSDPLPVFEDQPAASEDSAPTPPPVQSAQPAEVMVHVAGQVKSSGVYTLPAGKRVIDAIHAAGGTKADADKDAINLAARLVDGEQIYVPKKGATPPAASVAPPAPSASRPASSGRASSSAAAKGPVRVNVNRAGIAELDRLPGVGPATAQSIIEYRKAAGGFARPEDLMNVRGIGPKKFAQMKQWVVVN